MLRIPIGGTGGRPKSGQQVMSEGEGIHLLTNSDLNNTIFLSENQYVDSTDQSAIPLSPQSFLVLDGKENVYAACDPGQSAILIKIRGGLGFFQSGIRSGGFQLGPTGLFLYNAKPALGNPPVVSITPPGVIADPFGNPTQPDVVAYQSGTSDVYAQLLEAALILHQTTEFVGGSITETQPGGLLLVPGKKTSLDVQLNVTILSKLAAGNPVTGTMIVGGGANLTSSALEVQGALDVTTGVKAIVSGAEETAQSFSFINGWAAGARSTPQFFMCAAPAIGTKQSVLMAGSFIVPGAGYVAGQNIASAIPAAYRPANPFRILGWDTTNGILVSLNLGNGGFLSTSTTINGIPSAGDNIDMIPTIYALNN